MARAALDWSQSDLAKVSGVSARTVIRFEAGESVLPGRVKALREAFERNHVQFVDAGPLSGGVIPPQVGTHCPLAAKAVEDDDRDKRRSLND